MRQTAKMNAMRSGLVVVGALAFGYLTLHLGFKPFLENAQRTMDLELELEHKKSQQQQQPPFDFPDSSSIVRD
ncbi:Outer envelope membrane protein 7 [Bienertia sinuspersici]